MSQARDLANLANAADTVDATELDYLNGVTSNVQTQLDNKEAADATIVKDADIGVTVQGYDADTTKNDTANTFTKTQTWTKGADVSSGAALSLGDGNYFDITGTTAITSIATKGVGTVVKLHFDGALTLTHHATDLVLPGGANITTAAGDEAEFVEYATGDWRCTAYTKASGEAVVAAGGGLEEFDMWYLTSQLTNPTSGVITANLSRVPTSGGFGLLGTGMSQSSGVFTFPSTGKWKVEFVGVCEHGGSAEMDISIVNNSNVKVAEGIAVNPYASGDMRSTNKITYLFNVTSTSTVKVKFRVDRSGDGNLLASNNPIFTCMTFMKVAQL